MLDIQLLRSDLAGVARRLADRGGEALDTAAFEKIEALNPDLILAFSDLQADIAAELIRRGHTVVTFNQRSVAEILQMIRMLGGLIGRGDAAEALAQRLEQDLDRIRESALVRAAADLAAVRLG